MVNRFYVGMTLSWRAPWWRRVLRWLRLLGSRREPLMVRAIDHRTGTITLGPPLACSCGVSGDRHAISCDLVEAWMQDNGYNGLDPVTRKPWKTVDLTGTRYQRPS